jgi:Ca2+-dependent lipid-binding protein
MENSILTVHILQAEDLRATDSQSKIINSPSPSLFIFLIFLIIGDSVVEPYVILAIENQKIETRTQQASSSKPTWDEKFTFEISTGQEDLQVLIVNKDVYATNELIGKCQIPLSTLADQMKHDSWFELEAPENNEYKDETTAGSVRL